MSSGEAAAARAAPAAAAAAAGPPEPAARQQQQQQQQQRHGRRLRALGDAFHRTVKYALRPADYEQFQENFPAFGDAFVQDMYSGYKQALHHTRVNIEADFEELCEEHELRDKLNSLEVVCEEQGVGDGADGAADAARQPAGGLAPTNAIRLSLLRARQAEVESLRGVLAAVGERNAELQGELEGRRRAVRELVARAQPAAAQLESVHLCSKAWANRGAAEEAAAAGEPATA